MDSYRITPQANRDIHRILAKLERDEGVRVALHVEDALFQAFEDLVRLPQIGHKRDGLGRPGDLFHKAFRYVIVFEREPRVVVLRVVHGARDLQKRLH